MRRVGSRGFGAFASIAAVAQTGFSMQSPRRFVAEASLGASASSVHCPSSPRLCIVRPDLVGEWIPKMNSEDVMHISSASPAEVHWKCRSCGNVWLASVRARVAEQIHCPQCAHSRMQPSGSSSPSSGNAETAFQQSHPNLAALWDAEKNLNLSPSDVTANSSRQVWWKDPAGGPSFLRAVAHFVLDSTSPSAAAKEEEAAQLALLAEIESLSHATPMHIPTRVEFDEYGAQLAAELAPHKHEMLALWAQAGAENSASQGALHYEPPAATSDVLKTIREVRLEELVLIAQGKKNKAGNTSPEVASSNQQPTAPSNVAQNLPSFVFEKDWKTFFTLTSNEAAQDVQIELGSRRRRIVVPANNGDTQEFAFASSQPKREKQKLVLPEPPSVADEIIDDAKYIPKHIQSAIRANISRKPRPDSYSSDTGGERDSDFAHGARGKRNFRSATSNQESSSWSGARSAALPEMASTTGVSDITQDAVEGSAADAVGLSPSEARQMQYRRQKPFVPRRTRRGFVLPDEAADDMLRVQSPPSGDQRAAVIAAAAASLPKKPRVVARPKARAAEADE